MDASYKRHSRRSHPNLQHLSVTPLTPQYPLPATEDLSSPLARSASSYISPKSLPQTPSILSRSPSRTRQRISKSSHALVDLSHALTPLQASKSTISLRSRANSSARRARATPADRDNATWLLQTASLLTTSAAESKGQAWLSKRASSTSLGDYIPSPYPEQLESAYKADDEFSPVSTRYSRPGSRYASARGSRRGSRVGLMTPMGVRTPGEEEPREEYFEDVAVDFVDGDGEEDDDEGEMRRVVWGRVGGWVDWAVGWMDFRADGEEEREGREGEDEDEGGEGQGNREEDKQTDGRRRRKRREEIDRVVMQKQDEVQTLEVPPPQGGGGWNDAAWLLGVAKKALI
ncbi:hypothetical protein MMC13_003900 [Lambiella insularis]|nr:hypothetical protein [Lambiella insularis]